MDLFQNSKFKHIWVLLFWLIFVSPIDGPISEFKEPLTCLSFFYQLLSWNFFTLITKFQPIILQQMEPTKVEAKKNN